MRPCLYITKIEGPFADCDWFMRRLFPPEKMERFEKTQPSMRLYASVAAECLLFYGVFRQFGLKLQKESRHTGRYGKPLAEGNVHFSLSHSGDMALAAVFDKPIGADIQQMRAARPDIARRVFSPEEYAAYTAAKDRDAFFLSVWTLKESYLKYKGTGFCTDPRKFTCYPRDGHIVQNMPGCRYSLFHTETYCIGACAADSCENVVFLDFTVLRDSVKIKIP